MAIAETNPLRYRGYYYDNESGLYYLQSRYYDPKIGRFISADSAENINTNNVLALNAYIYCFNNPIAFSDSAGTYPQLSINVADITALFRWISTKADNNIDNAINGINKLIDTFHKINEKYQAKRDNTSQKIESYLSNPLELINAAFDKLKNSAIGQVVSNITNQLKEKVSNDLNSIKEQLIEKVFLIRVLHKFVNQIKVDINITKDSEEEQSPTAYGLMKVNIKSNAVKTSDNNAIMAIFHGLIAAIELDWINEILEFFGSSLDKLAKKSFNAVKQGCLIFITTFNTYINYLKNSFSLDIFVTGESEYLKYADRITNGGEPFVNAKGIGHGFAGFISFFKFVLDMDSAGTGTYSKTEDIIMASISLATNIVSIFIPFGWGMVVSGLGDLVPEIVILIRHGLIMPI